MKLNINRVAQVVITHAHFDHIGGLTEILANLKTRIMVHSEDEPAIKEIYDEKVIKLEDSHSVSTELGSLKVIHTPGHTQGSICLYEEKSKALFSGDTVFADGSFGRVNMPTSDAAAMIRSLEKIKKLDIQALLPGHGDYVLTGGSNCVRMAYDGAKYLL